jgi:DtxR family Mn-dependent transcriptional regulator
MGVHACTGAPAAARIKAAVASALDDAGLSLPGGELVVAIDGCSSACIRRSLEAQGVSPLAVTLEEFGVAPDEDVHGPRTELLRHAIVERLKAQATSASPPVRLRREAPPQGVKGAESRAHTSDDYLYAVHLLTSPVAACGSVVTNRPTTATRIADALSVTRVSAGEALARLEASGHVSRGPAKEVLLTGAGHSAVEQVVRRHRLVERFLVDVLGCSVAESYGLALELRDAFPDVLTGRIEALVAASTHCPHGWPLDPADDLGFASTLTAASALPPGATGTVAALVERDAAALARLSRYGVEPGTAIEVRSHDPRGTVVFVEGRSRVLQVDDAAATLVARAEPGGATRASTH